jgi:hypothetical protein
MIDLSLRHLRIATCVLCLVAAFRPASAQSTWLARYQSRLAATQTQQPHWATPLVTVAPRLEQGFRTDFVRQSIPAGQQTWNYGNTKGLQIVPLRRVELRFSPPPFITHTNPRTEDGFGDVAFRMKVRLYGSSEQHRNAIVTAVLGASVPTGKSGNGSCCAILTPIVEAGKGFGLFTFTTSLGGSLPVTNAIQLGRQIVWNNAAQYHATHFLWVEIETNTTSYFGGKYDGKSQTFATPGIIVSRIPLAPGGPSSPLAISLGIGEQIALTHFNTYNRSPIFTARLRF